MTVGHIIINMRSLTGAVGQAILEGRVILDQGFFNYLNAIQLDCWSCPACP